MAPPILNRARSYPASANIIDRTQGLAISMKYFDNAETGAGYPQLLKPTTDCTVFLLPWNIPLPQYPNSSAGKILHNLLLIVDSR
jgi:hypothetical protein